MRDLVFATYLAPCLRPVYGRVTESVGSGCGVRLA